MAKYRAPEEYYVSDNSSNYNLIKIDADAKTKSEDIEKVLLKLSKQRIKIRNNDTKDYSNIETLAKGYLDDLNEDGSFSDLPYTFKNAVLGITRLCDIVTRLNHYHFNEGKSLCDLPNKVIVGLINYLALEKNHEDRGPSRFHASCFKLPSCCMKIFLALLPDMMRIESEKCTAQEHALYTALCDGMMQAWELPLRGDDTDNHPITLERFRNHVWWVGGNALSFRAIHYVAICLRDVRMLELLLTVSKEAMHSKANQTTETFWEEGICADGWGWGHGPQTCNNGYPTICILSILDLLSHVKDTVWESLLPEFDFENIANIACGITWNLDGEYFPPIMDRTCFIPPKNGVQNRALMMRGKAEEISKILLFELGKFLSEETRKSLELYLNVGAKEYDLLPNKYNGARYFFNNDALVAKNKSRYFYLSMASARCKGVEFADCMSDKRNMFLKDGIYIIEKHENAYKYMQGSWNLTHLPGLTTRHIQKENLISETNWSGYNSIYNFAGGIAHDNFGVAGFIYQKDSTRYPDGAGRISNIFTKEILGTLAHKASFVYDDLFVFLGAGVTDTLPEYGGNIRTTVNNTSANNCKIYKANGEEISFVGQARYSSDVYVKNDGITYAVYPTATQTIELCCENRQTDWQYLNFHALPEDDFEVCAMELAINHANAPKDDSYHYRICTNENMSIEDINSSAVVISNTKQAQAVCFNDYRAFQAVFYEAGEIKTEDIYVYTSAPIILAISKTSTGKFEVSVADPVQNKNLSAVDVEFSFGEMSTIKIKITLPRGEYTGKAVSVEI